MKRLAIPMMILVALAGCQQSTSFSSPSGASASTVGVTTLTADAASAKFVNATAIGFDEIMPSHASKAVTVHPFTRLRSEPACSRVISLAFSSHHNYSDTMVALKNRAALLGGNALGVTNWVESSSHMYMVAHFYSCSSKKHI